MGDPELPTELRRAMSETFASEYAARRWLSRPVPAFNGLTPLEMVGRGHVAEVVAALDALNHGLFT